MRGATWFTDWFLCLDNPDGLCLFCRCRPFNNNKLLPSGKWLHVLFILLSQVDFQRESQNLNLSGWWHIHPLFINGILFILEISVIQIFFPLFFFSEWRRSCGGSHPRAGVRSWSLEKQYAFLSSLRALCLSLAITVCHTAECRGCSLSSILHPSIPPSLHSLTQPPLQMEKTSHPPLLKWC